MAVNCCVLPRGIEGIAGVTAIDTRFAGVTEISANPVIAPEAAVTLTLPIDTAETTPCPFTVATAEFAELQLTELVRS